MMLFAPAILHGDSVIELPRPITVCRIHDSWDFLKLKVPRVDGDQIAGPSRDGVDLTLEGQIGSHSGEFKLTEADMLAAAETLRTALDAEADEGFAVGIFRYDNGTYRYFRHCLTTRLDLDFSSQHLFTYAISIHAADPVLYSGLPAVSSS